MSARPPDFHLTSAWWLPAQHAAFGPSARLHKWEDGFIGFQFHHVGNIRKNWYQHPYIGRYEERSLPACWLAEARVNPWRTAWPCQPHHTQTDLHSSHCQENSHSSAVKLEFETSHLTYERGPPEGEIKAWSQLCSESLSHVKIQIKSCLPWLTWSRHWLLRYRRACCSPRGKGCPDRCTCTMRGTPNTFLSL